MLHSMLWLARRAVAFPKLTILVVLLMTVGFTSRLPTLTVDDEVLNMMPADHPARLLQERIEQQFGVRDLVILAVENARGVFNPESLARLKALSDFLAGQPGIVAEDVASLAALDNVVAQADELLMRPPLQAIPPDAAAAQAIRDEVRDNPLFVNRLVSADGTVAAVYAPIAEGSTRRAVHAAVMRHLSELTPPGNGDRILVSGKVMIEGALGAAMRSDLRRLAPIVVVVLLTLLTLYFRHVGLALLPVLTAMITVVWTLGLLAALGVPVYLPTTLIPVMLLVIGITDEVHLLGVYRRQGLGEPRRQALLAALARIARPVTLTSITTAAGFLALAASPIVPLTHFGLFTAFGIGVAYLLTFTLTPAYLALLRRPRDWEHAAATRFEPGLGKLGHRLAQRPVTIGLALAVLGGLAAWGAAGTHVDENWVNRFKPGHVLFESDTRLNQTLGGTTMLYGRIMTGDEGLKDPRLLARIDALQSALAALPQVGKVTSLADLLKQSNRVLHGGDPTQERLPPSPQAVAQQLLLLESSGDPNDLKLWIDGRRQRTLLWIQLKNPYASTARALLPAMERLASEHLGTAARATFGGPAHVNVAMADLVVTSQLRSLGLSLAAVFLVLLVLYRSPAWAGLALLPLALALAGVFAFLTFTGRYIDIPLAVLASIAIGLAVDYAIYVLDRYRASRTAGEAQHVAVGQALVESGSIVVTNSLVLVAGFSVLAFSHFAPLTAIGLLTAGVLVASALVSLLLPALAGRLALPRPAATTKGVIS